MVGIVQGAPVALQSVFPVETFHVAVVQTEQPADAWAPHCQPTRGLYSGLPAVSLTFFPSRMPCASLSMPLVPAGRPELLVFLVFPELSFLGEIHTT